MTAKTKLTKNQEKVMNTIRNYVKKTGQSPTFSELRSSLLKKGMELKSNNSIVQYLKVLEGKGYIQRFNKVRGIRLLNETGGDFVEIPLVGQANCGEALSFVGDLVEDWISISRRYIKGAKEKYFFVRAVGDSMDKSDINSGDLVLVKKSEEVPAEDKVVVAAINGLGTIKKLKKIDKKPVLMPDSTNKKHQPIILHEDDDINIVGEVMEVFNMSAIENNY